MPAHYTSTPRICPQCGKVLYRPPSCHSVHCSRACRHNSERLAVTERFWRHVDKSGTCWLWTGSLSGSGYGQFWPGGRRGDLTGAHRFSWELHNGPIPDGLHVCHHCDVKLCVRPDHLFLGTASDNNQDMTQKGRHASRTNPDWHVKGNAHPWRTHPERFPVGEQCSHAKLTNQQVLEVRRRYDAGETNKVALGREYGVSDSLIRAIVHRRIWRHI